MPTAVPVHIYAVQGDSMSPGLRHGDYLLTRPVVGRRKRRLARGDIIVFAAGGQRRIKRIVGLPHDRITLADGMLLINGDRFAEPYLNGMPPYPGLAKSDCELGGGEYFVMGDNRAHSTDSRHYGPIRLSQIECKALCRIWPPLRR